jgi:hypothetical protein
MVRKAGRIGLYFALLSRRPRQVQRNQIPSAGRMGLPIMACSPDGSTPAEVSRV